MRPDDGASRPAGPHRAIDQRFQRRHHVAIAQVPRFGAAPEHRPVVRLGIAHHARVLLGGEVLVRGDAAIALRVLRRAAPQLHELFDNVVLTRSAEIEAGHVAIPLDVVAECVEARVTVASVPGRRRINLVEVFHDSRHGSVKAVEIQPIEPDSLSGVAMRCSPREASGESARPRGCATSSGESE